MRSHRQGARITMSSYACNSPATQSTTHLRVRTGHSVALLRIRVGAGLVTTHTDNSFRPNPIRRHLPMRSLTQLNLTVTCLTTTLATLATTPLMQAASMWKKGTQEAEHSTASAQPPDTTNLVECTSHSCTHSCRFPAIRARLTP